MFNILVSPSLKYKDLFINIFLGLLLVELSWYYRNRPVSCIHHGSNQSKYWLSCAIGKFRLTLFLYKIGRVT